jgi:hypothetical protein
MHLLSKQVDSQCSAYSEELPIPDWTFVNGTYGSPLHAHRVASLDGNSAKLHNE